MNKAIGWRLLAAGMLLVGLAARGSAAPERRPNFLFVYTDDQRWDAMGVVQREQGDKGRFPWMLTPSMDRLAAEGVRFRNAFVVNSLCAPSRATFLTGRYGHLNGVVNNHTPFPESNVTYASLLRKAGYVTGYVGKWHMGNQRGQRPGFDFSASFIGQGRYVDCPVEVNGRPTETHGWIDDVSTDYAVGFLKEHKDQPFALAVGFKSSHGPWEPPARHQNNYAGEQARSVPNLGVPAIYTGGAKKQAPPPGAPVATNLNYFRTITAADEDLGRLLQTLDDLKLTENTVVIFTSDNGYYQGEHGLGDKRTAYDESMRIPMIVRYPKLRARNVARDEMVLNTDIAPTLLDYAGVPVPAEMQGRSWRPLLEGQKTDWRNAFFYAYFFETPYRIPTVTAVRTDTAKLIRYPGHDEWTELFDLKNDPFEMKNLIVDPASAELKQRLEREYERQKEAIGFVIPPFADDPKKDEARPALKAWVLDYQFDRLEAERVPDASGHGNAGTVHGLRVVDGPNGTKAAHFDGKAYVEVPKSKSLDPSVAGWTVEATFKTEAPDGVILACGGQSNGYCLYVKDGKPAFGVVAANRRQIVTAATSVVGQWTHVTARMTAGGELRLLVDGQPPVTARLASMLITEPREATQIGTDLATRVIAGDPLPGFTGSIATVRLYSGDSP